MNENAHDGEVGRESAVGIDNAENHAFDIVPVIIINQALYCYPVVPAP